MPIATPTQRRERPGWMLIAILVLAAIISSFESTMIYTALPDIIVDFQSTPSDAGWIITGFLLVAAASAATAGRLGDVYGRRNVLVVVLLASIVGSIISLVSGSLGGLIVGRSIQGLAGGLIPLCVGILRETVTAKKLPVAIATVAGAAMWGGAAGNLIAGNIVSAWGWEYVFVVAAVAAGVSAVGGMLLPRPSLTASLGRFDWVGGLLFVPGIALALFGVNETHEWGWASGKTVACIGGGVVVLALWFAWELRVAEPLINVRFFLNRKLGLTLAACALVSFGTLGISGFIGQLVMQSPDIAPVGLGLSPAIAGDLSFAVGIIGFALAPLSGRISRGGRARNAFMVGALFAVAAAVLSAVLLDTVVGWIVSQVVLTAATAFLLSSLPNLIVEGAPAENTSEATGVYTVVQTAFAGIGASIGTLLLSSNLVEGTPFTSRGGYNLVFVLVAVASAAALAVAALIRTNHTDAAAPVSPVARARADAGAVAVVAEPI